MSTEKHGYGYNESPDSGGIREITYSPPSRGINHSDSPSSVAMLYAEYCQTSNGPSIGGSPRISPRTSPVGSGMHRHHLSMEHLSLAGPSMEEQMQVVANDMNRLRLSHEHVYAAIESEAKRKKREIDRQIKLLQQQKDEINRDVQENENKGQMLYTDFNEAQELFKRAKGNERDQGMLLDTVNRISQEANTHLEQILKKSPIAKVVKAINESSFLQSAEKEFFIKYYHAIHTIYTQHQQAGKVDVESATFSIKTIFSDTALKKFMDLLSEGQQTIERINSNGSITYRLEERNVNDPESYATIHTDIQHMAVDDLKPLGDLSRSVNDQKRPTSMLEMVIGRSALITPRQI